MPATPFPDPVAIGDTKIKISALSQYGDDSSVVLCAGLDTGGTWTVTTVPIPAAAWLFGSGVLGLARRKKV